MSAWLIKTKGVPGAAPGGYEWQDTKTPVEVHDDALAAELLEIPDAGFLSVPAPEDDTTPERVEVTEAPTGAQTVAEAGAETGAEDGADKPVKPARKATAAKNAPKPAGE